MSERKYVLLFFTGLLTALLAVAAFDRIVDPFWYFRDFSFRGFNEVKTKFRRYERHVKPEILVREQPESVIFGSSYAEIGLDPGHLAKVSGESAYNFALAGASWKRVYCDVQYAMRYDRNLRTMVLGIHPESMPARDCSAEIRSMRHPDILSFLISADALKASVETVYEQGKDPPSHTEQGLYYYTRGKAGTEDRFRQFLSTHNPCGETQQKIELDGVENIIREAEERHVELKLVVYPRHAMPVELDYLCHARPARWQTLSKIVSLTGSGENVEIWDFEGFHDIALEPVSEASGRYWQDPAHFNYEYGNIMLDEMFGKMKPFYGVRLTPGNIHEREKAEEIERKNYLRSHPDFDQEVISLSRP